VQTFFMPMFEPKNVNSKRPELLCRTFYLQAMINTHSSSTTLFIRVSKLSFLFYRHGDSV